ELSAELLLHPKERAEHIMLVDLERNDLGRICQPGTIRVDDLMVLETYAHVHHIVSDVSGKLKAAVSPGDIIRAVFPGGTITGCPKVRCMEIIAELETEARDAYTGSVGYLCQNGDMDLNILIRTITHKDNHYTFRAGAGIVADSDPLRELHETRSKAMGMQKIFSLNQTRK
ncbi:MAG: chorismate-binding protein, partial [Arenicellales bacterium]